MGLTDVDDKIITRARSEHGTPSLDNIRRLANRFESRFFEDMQALNVRETPPPPLTRQGPPPPRDSARLRRHPRHHQLRRRPSRPWRRLRWR
jgi:hypothetical protein